MEQKTKLHAESGHHDLVIKREFDLPVELLFKAHVESEIFEQWMSHEYATTKILKFESKKYGCWQFETTDAKGNKVFGAHGVFHEIVPNQKITRTFESENSTIDVQLEFLEFEKLTDRTSRFTMHTIFRSGAHRDELLKFPFAQGLNMAHNRLQEIMIKQVQKEIQ